jgi:sodium pump decarboxylase gamma subunit
MILVGFKLTFIGMGIVFIFLTILVYLVKITGRLLAKETTKELEALRVVSRAKLKKLKKEIAHEEDEILVAVISAAISAHQTNVANHRLLKERLIAS